MSVLGRLRRPALILHYHSLGDVPREQDPYHLAIPVETFRSHLSALRRRGYEFLAMAEFAARMAASGGKPPEGACAITFDDGTEDNLALPELLAEAGAKATVFVCPGLLGEAHRDYAPEAGMRILTQEELQGLAAHDSIEIGSHTMRHTPLDDATADEAFREMDESKGVLEQLLGTEVTSFAYPSCGYSHAAPEAAARAGYTSAVTCLFKGGWEPFELARESFGTLDGRLAFELKSRRLWTGLYRSAPGRLARRLASRRRHG
jgi:peptidoglycan/xylan/chitin deacetylase (PgdA/CDA1 family)